MENKNKLNKLWPTYLGEFYNPEHKLIKEDLIKYFLWAWIWIFYLHVINFF